jgi:hypothetical protein
MIGTRRRWGDAPAEISRQDLYGMQAWQWLCRLGPERGCERADASDHAAALDALVVHQRTEHDLRPARIR